jgi:hypothetical protein
MIKTIGWARPCRVQYLVHILHVCFNQKHVNDSLNALQRSNTPRASRAAQKRTPLAYERITWCEFMTIIISRIQVNDAFNCNFTTRASIKEHTKYTPPAQCVGSPRASFHAMIRPLRPWLSIRYAFGAERFIFGIGVVRAFEMG